MDIVITTDRHPSKQMIDDALALSRRWNKPYANRDHRSIEFFKKTYGKSVLSIDKELNFTVYTLKGQRLFYHPGLFKIRVLNFLKTGHDAMIDAMNLREGYTVLDCNLGLAQDALLSAFVSKKTVIGLEKDAVIAEMVRRGLKTYRPIGKLSIARFAFKLVKVMNADNANYLSDLPDKSFDVVYFSPMFIKPKWHCDVMSPMREVAVKDFVSRDVLKQAERVARKRVVIKINRGREKLFPFLSDYTVTEGSTHIAYVYKEIK